MNNPRFPSHRTSSSFRTSLPLLALLSLTRTVSATNPFVQYAVDFPDPKYITTSKFGSDFNGAKGSIVAWANEMSAHGPWSVTNKPVVAPSGDKHDYMSWAPYQWADCSNVKNTTELSLADESKQCKFVYRDGQVNPERFIIQDFQSFFNLSDAVLFNSLAAVLENKPSSTYSQNVAKFINTWFLDANTGMNPNLKYAQMGRGPDGQLGAYTGILDLRGFAKISSGIQMLRLSKNADWTTDLDAKFVDWCKQYIDWLDTSANAQQAAHSTNNHGTIFVNQYAALKLIVKDTASAQNWTNNYFDRLFKTQVSSSGDQPEEAGRTHPYHYRNFNIAGMITNARILSYADPSSKPWNKTTSDGPGGANIHKVLDFLMSTDPNAKGESDITSEIYPNVMAVASVYGESDGKYVEFLKSAKSANGLFAYADEPAFLWSQPLVGVKTNPDSRNGGSSMLLGRVNEFAVCGVLGVVILILGL